MAEGSATVHVPVRLDTRKAERQLSAFVKKAEGTSLRLKGIDSKKFTQPLGRITGSVTEFNKSLEASNARVIAFTASAGILFGVSKAFKEMAVAMVKVEHTLVDINVILGASTKNLAVFSKELFRVAKGTGQSFFEVGKAATEFSRQGLSMEKTLLRTRDALILTRLSGMDAESAVNALTAAINSFNRSALDSTTIVNKLANVDAAFAVSSRDLAEAIRRVASTAQTVNVDFDQLIAVVTSAQQTTARGGNVIGNSLKTIFTRIQRTEVIGQLEQLGIQVRTVTGEMRPAMTVLSELGKKFDTLSGQQKAYTAELVGGVYQMNVLKAILKDLGQKYSIYNSALETSKNTTDEAIRRNEELNKTLSATLNKALENLREFGAEAGKMTFEPALKRILGTFNKLAEETTIFGDIGKFFGFDEQEAKGFGKRVAGGIMESIGTFLSGPGLLMMGTVAAKLLMDFGKFLSKATVDFVGLNKNAQQQAVVQQEINAMLRDNPKLIDQIIKGEKSTLQVEREVVQALKDRVLQMQQLDSLSRKMAAGGFAAGLTAKIDKGAGTSTLATKSQGFVPEYLGAAKGGYQAGRERRSYIPGEGPVIWNSAEKKKKFAGIKQPAIMPPKESHAGTKYAKKFGSRWGFDPYAAQGFIPNFVKGAKMKVNDYRRKATMLVPTPDRKGTSYGMAGKEKYLFDIRGPDADSMKQGGKNVLKTLEKEMATRMKRLANRIADSLKPQPMAEGTSVDTDKHFNTGAVRGAMGTVFEAALNSAFKRTPDKQNVRWDVPPGQATEGIQSLFHYKGGPADYKATDERGTRNSMASKIRKEWSSRAEKKALKKNAPIKKTKAEGFVPNLLNVLTSLKLGLTEKVGNLKGGSMINMKGSTLASNVPQGRNGLSDVLRYILRPGERVRIQTMGHNTLTEQQKNSLPSSKGGGRAGQAKGLAQERMLRRMPGNRAVLTRGGPRKDAKDPDLPYDYVQKGKYGNIPGESKTITRQKGRGARMESKDQASIFVKTLYENSSQSLRQVRARLNRAAQQDPYAAELSKKFEANIRSQIGNREREIFNYTGAKASLSSVNEASGFSSNNAINQRRAALGRASGFIPNFSGKTRAMQTEKLLGGRPEFRTSPFPHVADGRTQKDFGDVMRDHPEGLSKAMKNSARAQGVASGGFVPNFQEGSSGLEGGMAMMGMGMAAMAAKELADGMKELGTEVGDLDKKVKSTEEAYDQQEKAMQKSIDAETKKAEGSLKEDKKIAEQPKRQKEEDKARKADQKARKAAGLTDDKGNLMRPGSKAEKEALAGGERGKRGTVTGPQKERVEAAKKRLALAKKENKMAKDLVAESEKRLAISKKGTKKQKADLAAAGTQRDQARATAGKAPRGKLGRGVAALGKNPFGAMMMATAGVGIARGLVGKSKAGGVAVDAAEGAAQLGAMGAMLGPWGAAAGAAAGGLMGLAKGLSKLNDPLPEMKKGAEAATEALNTFNNSSSAYLSAFEKFNSSFDEPSITGEEMTKRQHSLEDAFLELPAQVKARFAGVVGDSDKIKDIFASIGKDLAEKAKTLNAQVQIESKIQEKRTGWWAGTKRFFGGQENEVFTDTAEGEKSLNDVFTNVWSQVDAQKLKGPGGKAVQAQMDAAFKAAKGGQGVGQLTEVLKGLNVDERFLKQIARIGKNTSDASKMAKKFNTEIAKSVTGLDDLAKNMKITSQLRAIDKIYNDAMRENIKLQQITAAVMKTVIEREKERIFFLNKIGGMKDTFRMNYAVSMGKGALDAAKPFLGARSAKTFETDLKVRDIQKKQLGDIAATIQKSNSKNFSIINAEMLKISGEIATAWKQKQGNKPARPGVEQDLARNVKIQRELMPLVVKHLKSIAEDPKTVGIPDEVIDKLGAVFQSAGLKGGKERARLITEQLIKNNMTTENKLGEIILKSNMEIALQEEQLKWQKKAIEVQERLEKLGGAGDYLAAAGPTGLSASFAKIVPMMEQSYMAFHKIHIKLAGIEENTAGMVDQGRASFQIMDDLMNNLKLRIKTDDGSYRRLGTGDLGPLPGMAVLGRAEDLRMQTEMRRVMTSLFIGQDLSRKGAENDPRYGGLARGFNQALAPGVRDANGNMGASAMQVAAAEQIAAQLKLENIPEEIAELRAASETMSEIMASHSATFQQKNEVAFENALRSVGLHEMHKHWRDITGQSTDDIVGATRKSTKGVSETTRRTAGKQLTQHAEIERRRHEDVNRVEKHNDGRHIKEVKNADKTGKGIQVAQRQGTVSVTRGVSAHAKVNDYNLHAILLAMTEQRDREAQNKKFGEVLKQLKENLKTGKAIPKIEFMVKDPISGRKSKQMLDITEENLQKHGVPIGGMKALVKAFSAIPKSGPSALTPMEGTWHGNRYTNPQIAGPKFRRGEGLTPEQAAAADETKRVDSKWGNFEDPSISSLRFGRGKWDRTRRGLFALPSGYGAGVPRDPKDMTEVLGGGLTHMLAMGRQFKKLPGNSVTNQLTDNYQKLYGKTKEQKQFMNMTGVSTQTPMLRALTDDESAAYFKKRMAADSAGGKDDLADQMAGGRTAELQRVIRDTVVQRAVNIGIRNMMDENSERLMSSKKNTTKIIAERDAEIAKIMEKVGTRGRFATGKKRLVGVGVSNDAGGYDEWEEIDDYVTRKTKKSDLRFEVAAVNKKYAGKITASETVLKAAETQERSTLNQQNLFRAEMTKMWEARIKEIEDSGGTLNEIGDAIRNLQLDAYGAGEVERAEKVAKTAEAESKAIANDPTKSRTEKANALTVAVEKRRLAKQSKTDLAANVKNKVSLFSEKEKKFFDTLEAHWRGMLEIAEEEADMIDRLHLSDKERQKEKDKYRRRRESLKKSTQQALAQQGKVAVGGNVFGPGGVIFPKRSTKKLGKEAEKYTPEGWDAKDYEGFVSRHPEIAAKMYHPTNQAESGAVYEASLLDLRQKGQLGLGPDYKTSQNVHKGLSAIGLSETPRMIKARDEKLQKVTSISLKNAQEAAIKAFTRINQQEVKFDDGTTDFLDVDAQGKLIRDKSDKRKATKIKDSTGTRIMDFDEHWKNIGLADPKSDQLNTEAKRKAMAGKLGIEFGAGETLHPDIKSDAGKKLIADKQKARLKERAREIYVAQLARAQALRTYGYIQRHHIEAADQMQKILKLNQELEESTGTDAESVARRKALLKKLAEIELATAKIQTQRERVTLQQTLASRTKFADEKSAAYKAHITQRIRSGDYEMSDTMSAIGESWKYGTKEMNRDTDALFQNTAETFRSGVNRAFSDAIHGTKELRDSFADMFGAISRMMGDKIMEMFLNKVIFNNVGAFMSGGAPAPAAAPVGKASGGLVTGGSGMRDDIPAMLTGGEYVLKKSSVSKYGQRFLDQINEGQAAERGLGGGLALFAGVTGYNIKQGRKAREKSLRKRREREAKRMAHHQKLMSEAQAKGLTPGTIETDPQWKAAHGDLNAGRYAKVAKKNAFLYDDPMFPSMGKSRMDIDKSLSRRALMDEDNSLNAFRMEKQSNLWNYRKQNEQNKLAWHEQIKTWKEKKKAAMKAAFINAGLSLATGWISGADSPFSMDQNKNVWGKAKRGLSSMKSRLDSGRADTYAQSFVNPDTGNAYANYAELQANSFEGHIYAGQEGFPFAHEGMMKRIPGGIPKTAKGWAWDNPVPSNAYLPVNAPNFAMVNGRQVPARMHAQNTFNERTAWGPLNKPRWQTKKAKGGHAPDDVAALLMGGEYVISRNAVQRHGTDFFDRLNRGELPRFAEGGLVGEDSLLTPDNNGIGGQTNNINITVNVDKNGQSIVSVSEDGNSQEEGKVLAEQIRKQVMVVLMNQKRQGGVLASSFNKGNSSG